MDINALGGRHIDTWTHKHTHTNAQTKLISRNQADAPAPGLKSMETT